MAEFIHDVAANRTGNGIATRECGAEDTDLRQRHADAKGIQ